MMPLIYQRERAPAAPRPIRWTARQRAAVVLAVASCRLAPGELERRYGISPDEFHDWQQRAARGLRAIDAALARRWPTSVGPPLATGVIEAAGSFRGARHRCRG